MMVQESKGMMVALFIDDVMIYKSLVSKTRLGRLWARLRPKRHYTVSFSMQHENEDHHSVKVIIMD